MALDGASPVLPALSLTLTPELHDDPTMAVPRLIGFVVFLASAATAEPPAPAPIAASYDRICLVLSVGGPDGIAHLGAIEAVKQAQIPIGCVAGNSMGALVGSLYATAPDFDTSKRYTQLMQGYTKDTEQRMREAAWSAVALPIAGALLLNAERELDWRHFRTELDRFFYLAKPSTMPVPFTTSYVTIGRSGVERRVWGSAADMDAELARMVTQASTGGGFDAKSFSTEPLSTAVSKSIANPLIFTELNPVKDGFTDPGIDRMERTPVVTACERFPTALLIAINVTGEPIYGRREVPCPVIEVQVPQAAKGYPARDVMRGVGAAFDDVVRRGREETSRVLGAAGLSPTRPLVGRRPVVSIMPAPCDAVLMNVGKCNAPSPAAK